MRTAAWSLVLVLSAPVAIALVIKPWPIFEAQQHGHVISAHKGVIPQLPEPIVMPAQQNDLPTLPEAPATRIALANNEIVVEVDPKEAKTETKLERGFEITNDGKVVIEPSKEEPPSGAREIRITEARPLETIESGRQVPKLEVAPFPEKALPDIDITYITKQFPVKMTKAKRDPADPTALFLTLEFTKDSDDLASMIEAFQPIREAKDAASEQFLVACCFDDENVMVAKKIIAGLSGEITGIVGEAIRLRLKGLPDSSEDSIRKIVVRPRAANRPQMPMTIASGLLPSLPAAPALAPSDIFKDLVRQASASSPQISIPTSPLPTLGQAPSLFPLITTDPIK